MLRIIHLSDVHLSRNNVDDYDMFLLPALLKDLHNINNQKRIDLICITGDLVDKGGISFNSTHEGFECFRDHVLEKISSHTDLSNLRNRIFFCPGNHDIDRSVVNFMIESGFPELVKDGKQLEEQVINNSVNREQLLIRLKDYKSFERGWFDSVDLEFYEHNEFHSVAMFNRSGLKVGLVMLNSAWRCSSDDDKGKLLLSDFLLKKAHDAILESSIKVAIMHHPIEHLQDYDQEFANSFISKHFDIFLCGHSHTTATCQYSGMFGNLLFSNAPSNWPDKIRDKNESVPSFQVIDFDRTNRVCTIEYKKYNHNQTSFVINTDLGNNGRNEYVIPTSEEHKKYVEELEVIDNILKSQIVELNDHLIGSTTSGSLSPKTIEDLFVHPIIYDEPKVSAQNKSRNTYKIDDICSSNTNTIILGTRESGKTVLLDMVYITYIRCYQKYRVIPIRFDLADCVNKDIEKVIGSIMRNQTPEIDKVLEKFSFVLLIDGLNMSNGNWHAVNRLKAFMRKFPGIRIITSYRTDFKDEVPVSIVQDEVLSSFTFRTIDEFKTEQIRNLVTKWFSNYVVNDSNEKKINNIVKTIKALNLPCNPLSLSIFLLIFEQQESYTPLNKAAMLENYIEQLLEKNAKKYIRSDEYNYNNKISLISDIAYKMLFDQNINYRIKKSDLLSFIENRYEAMKLYIDVSANDIVEELCLCGLMSLETDPPHEFIRFRFTCFFNFFLAKKMQDDKEFLDEVMKDEYYLGFIDVVDYYTALTGNRDSILETVLSRMSANFDTLNQDIRKLNQKHDEFFITEQTVIQQIADQNKFIKQLSDNRPSQAALDALTDKELEEMPHDTGIAKFDFHLNPITRLDRSWVITAICLKNTEECKNIASIKSKAFNEIIQCSMSFACLYKIILENEYKHRPSSFDNKHLVIKDFMPLIHEVCLLAQVGTKKLEIVIREIMIEALNNDQSTDIEKFTLVFLYSDLRGTEYLKYIRRFIKGIKHKYIYDMVLFKLISYYYLRSKTPESNKKYESLIGDVLVTAKRRKKSDKGSLVEHYKRVKKDRSYEEFISE